MFSRLEKVSDQLEKVLKYLAASKPCQKQIRAGIKLLVQILNPEVEIRKPETPVFSQNV